MKTDKDNSLNYIDDLESIFLSLVRVIAPQFDSNKEHERIYQFLARLKNSKEFCAQKMLISLGIDIKGYSESSFFTHNFEKHVILLRKLILESIIHSENRDLIYDQYEFKTYTIIDDVLGLSITLKKNSINQLCPPVIATDKLKYFRIIKFKDLIEFTLTPNARYRNINKNIPLDLDKNEEKRYYKKLIDKRGFTEFNAATFGSKTGWVYVSNYEDFEEKIKKSQTLEILDSIGFYVRNIVIDENYVCVLYPPSFDEVIYQPNTLTGDWGSNKDLLDWNRFFLPYIIKDSWGRTCSVSGITQSAKERIHAMYNYYGNKYHRMEVVGIGSIKKSLVECQDSVIINEGIERFKSIQNSTHGER